MASRISRPWSHFWRPARSKRQAVLCVCPSSSHRFAAPASSSTWRNASTSSSTRRPRRRAASPCSSCPRGWPAYWPRPSGTPGRPCCRSSRSTRRASSAARPSGPSTSRRWVSVSTRQCLFMKLMSGFLNLRGD